MSLVLVADDEPAVLDALSGVVEDLGHVVVQAHDGREALELTRRRRPALVITDHMMPHLSGIDLCRTLKSDEELKSIPVILLSGATGHGTPAADAFLPKPFELVEFEKLIDRMLGVSSAAPIPAPAAPSVDETSALLAWVAHELRTPLSAARIQLHLFEKHAAKPEGDPKRRPLKSLKRQLATLELLAGVVADSGELLRGPLVISRAPTPLVDLVSKIVEGWRDRQPDIAIDYTPPAAEVTLHVDATRISRALETLLGNAMKHGAREKKVEVTLDVADKHFSIRVTDHGRGIPADKLGTLFSGFRKDEGAGHGLELYVASEVARAHGGGITVKTAPGEGATFTLSLPRS